MPKHIKRPIRPTVHPATTDDIAFMVRLFLDLAAQRHPSGDGIDTDAIIRGTQESTAAQIRGELPDSITYVIENGGEPVGRLRVVRTGEAIAGLQILPAAQSKGIGSAMIADLRAEAIAKGIPLVLEVEKDNPRAEHLYERLGFKCYGETEETFRMRIAPTG